MKTLKYGLVVLTLCLLGGFMALFFLNPKQKLGFEWEVLVPTTDYASQVAFTDIGSVTAYSYVTNSLEFDIIEQEKFQREAEVTTKKIQQGFDVSLGVRPRNPTLSFTAVVTNHPSSYVDRALASSFNRALFVYQKLLSLMDLKQPVSFISGLQVFENVIIKSISTGRSIDDGDSLTFDVSIVVVDIVETQSTVLAVNIKPKGLIPDKPTIQAKSTVSGDAAGSTLSRSYSQIPVAQGYVDANAAKQNVPSVSRIKLGESSGTRAPIPGLAPEGPIPGLAPEGIEISPKYALGESFKEAAKKQITVGPEFIVDEIRDFGDNVLTGPKVLRR